MRGFADKALLLFPKYESYENKSHIFKYQLRVAAENMVKYLKSRGIEPHMFYTDDIARDINFPDVIWVTPVGDQDRFFMKKYCVGMSDALERGMLEYPDIFNKVLAKDPGAVNMSENDRFEMVLRHVAQSSAQIIKEYKIICHFMMPKYTQYKVISKEGDGRIRIDVNVNTLLVKAYMSGEEQNPVDLFGIPCASRSMYLWEVE